MDAQVAVLDEAAIVVEIAVAAALAGDGSRSPNRKTGQRPALVGRCHSKNYLSTAYMEEMLPNGSAGQEATAASEQSEMSKGRWRRSTRDLLSTIVPAILIALLIHIFVAQATRVFGQSMQPGLQSNERLVIEKVSYWFHGPRRGDIVVIKDPEGGSDLLIKRVIGLPGERVTVADGRVYIDGVLINEPYLEQPTNGGGRTWLVPPLQVFVLGDNRAASRDSRVFGSVSRDTILGRAVFRYWPFTRIGMVT